MTDRFLFWQGVVDLIALNAILAYSQYIVLRAGVFSLATAGFASIGGYFAALSVTRFGWPAPLALLAAALLATLVALVLALPLARLRGVFQAIATLAFVQILLSVAQNATELTNGALGLNGIPRWTTTPILTEILAAIVYSVWALGRYGIGRAFDAIRQDETVAVSLGITVFRAHLVAFAMSGFLGGLGGALEAFHSYSITPDAFGFHLLVACLTFVVLGGRSSALGPLLGAAILTLLPELARPLKDYRLFVHGALLVALIIYLPEGIADTVASRWRMWRLARAVARESATTVSSKEAADGAAAG